MAGPPPILADILIVLALAAAAAWVFHLLRLPSIPGFLLAGVLAGPAGLGLVGDRHDIEALAEIGVALLLFVIGLEFSLRDILRMRRHFLGAGAAQVLATAGLVCGVAIVAGAAPPAAAFVGLLAAMSSTAIVMKLLGDRGELAAGHGRMTLAILLFQDLAAVFLMLVVPVVGAGGASAGEAAFGIAKALGVTAGIVLAAAVVVPRVLDLVVRTRSRELFTLATMVTVAGTAYLMAGAGVSLALGAFVAGVVISESPYAHQIMSDAIPFRDVFNGLFFISVGMLVDPAVVAANPGAAPALVALVVAGKALVAGGVALLFGSGLRSAVLVGTGLAQVGEFAFVLLPLGIGLGLLGPDDQSLFVAVSVGTMLLTPLLVPIGHRVAARLDRAGVRRAAEGGPGGDAEGAGPRDHVVIVGFGINGRGVARVLRGLGVPYSIVELNARTVSEESALGEPVIYGDATRDLVLRRAGADRARAVVVTIPDAAAARHVVAAARALRPEATVIVRTRFLAEVDALRALGADAVVAEEFETSIELAGLVMERYGAPPRAVVREKRAMRCEGYRALRDESGQGPRGSGGR